LDTKDLKIIEITLNGNSAEFELKEKTEKFGSPLQIPLPSVIKLAINVFFFEVYLKVT